MGWVWLDAHLPLFSNLWGNVDGGGHGLHSAGVVCEEGTMDNVMNNMNNMDIDIACHGHRPAGAHTLSCWTWATELVIVIRDHGRQQTAAASLGYPGH